MVLGHVALHYRCEEDAPKAARLLDMMGFIRLQEIRLPDGSMFYQFLINEDHRDSGVGTIYLSAQPRALADLNGAIREALRVGMEDEHPAVQSMRSAQVADPEAGFHIGIMVHTFDVLEGLIGRLEEANRNDADLMARLKLTLNRAKSGDPRIDALMDGSNAFSHTTRECYGRFGCQVFVETDLFACGPLGENMVIEFDHVFEGHPLNMFNKTELG